mmetsp:Transcript_17398/g.29275  ORF Transcript_17398/g.29275 Transcript_17398/m.29275 type:complete len:223 (+) Transcript_17398:519-1187(+)
MYRIDVEGPQEAKEGPRADPVIKKFGVSKDCVLGALILENNQIYVYRIYDHETRRFISEKKFTQSQSVFQHSGAHKDVIDLFIFKNKEVGFGQGQYSMYVASSNGIMLYDGVDRVDKSSIAHQSISNDFINQTLTPGALDCSAGGTIVFDLKAIDKKNQIKCYTKTKPEDKYDHTLEGDKKMLRFFGGYLVEVKTERNMDKIQIYDFDNKLSLFNAAYPTIF